jgi:hypothetical protein
MCLRTLTGWPINTLKFIQCLYCTRIHFIVSISSHELQNKSKLIQEEIKRRLNSGNACYQSVQRLLPSGLLPENVKMRIYKTTSIILPLVLYGCETWSLILMEEHRLRVFENRVLKRISRPKRNEVTGG